MRCSQLFSIFLEANSSGFRKPGGATGAARDDAGDPALRVTVEVGENELRWYFGPGFWSYRLPLDDIETVAAARNRWWNGFGIRRGPGFRLYNVSGLDAVELRLKSHEVRRIGTDDPQGLVEALKSARRGL